jgi:hypothetical protein
VTPTTTTAPSVEATPTVTAKPFIEESSTTTAAPFLEESSTTTAKPFVAESSTTTAKPFVEESSTTTAKPFIEESSTTTAAPLVEVIPTTTATPYVEIPVATTRAPEPQLDKNQLPTVGQVKVEETLSVTPETTTEPVDLVDLPRRVHVHDASAFLQEQQQKQEEERKEALREEIQENTTSSVFLGHETTPHLPRILENADDRTTLETLSTTVAVLVDHLAHATESTTTQTQTDSKVSLI